MQTLRWICLGLALALVGCGGSSKPEPQDLDASLPAADDAGDAAVPLPGPDAGPPDTGPVPIHQTVTSSVLPYVAPATSATITFRIPFTAMREGTEARVAFWADSAGTMTVRRAFIGRYVGGGVVEENTELTFGGKAEPVEVPAGGVVTSDPLAFPTVSGARYAVSFSASGTVAYGLDIGNDGVRISGDVPDRDDLSSGVEEHSVQGIKWVSFLGAPQRDIAVLGDSVGGGQNSAGTETRYISLAQKELGYPVVDASWGGDGVERAYGRIERDLLALPGITDCVVAEGTNDFHRADDEGSDAATDYLKKWLTDSYTRLRENGIRPWGATIPPRIGATEAREKTRNDVNAWICSTPLVEGCIDFAKVLADPDDPSLGNPDLMSRDGIHPSTAGHRAMADELVRFFRANP